MSLILIYCFSLPGLQMSRQKLQVSFWQSPTFSVSIVLLGMTKFSSLTNKIWCDLHLRYSYKNQGTFIEHLKQSVTVQAEKNCSVCLNLSHCSNEENVIKVKQTLFVLTIPQSQQLSWVRTLKSLEKYFWRPGWSSVQAWCYCHE